MGDFPGCAQAVGARARGRKQIARPRPTPRTARGDQPRLKPDRPNRTDSARWASRPVPVFPAGRAARARAVRSGLSSGPSAWFPVRLASPATALVSGFGVQVAAGDSFRDPGRRLDLGLGRLEDRGPALSGREWEGGADVVGGGGQAVAVGEPGGEIAVPLGGFLELAGGLRQDGSRGGRLAVVIVSPAVPGVGCDLVPGS
jgi:hypothetical protein